MFMFYPYFFSRQKFVKNSDKKSCQIDFFSDYLQGPYPKNGCHKKSQQKNISAERMKNILAENTPF